ncbi:MAG TPA: hypothetical protein VKA89_07945 [Solirubrobacterales bacterium]|nr:hypothetical protein [Solirubrobacterales bacterium]
MRRRVPELRDLLAAVERRAGDGFARADRVGEDFPRSSHRDMRRGIARAVAGGFLISRRHRGREHLAIAAEGWTVLRGEEEAA